MTEVTRACRDTACKKGTATWGVPQKEMLSKAYQFPEALSRRISHITLSRAGTER